MDKGEVNKSSKTRPMDRDRDLRGSRRFTHGDGVGWRGSTRKPTARSSFNDAGGEHRSEARVAAATGGE